MNNNLSKLRKEKNLTQQQLADSSKISLRTYQYIESGQKIPNVKIAFQLATILNCKIEDIFN